jgi:hypothetical protein
MIQVVGHCLLNSWETAALWGITAFCGAHPMEVVITAFGLFPAHDEGDILSRDRMDHAHVVTELDPISSLRITAWCMNALYRLQTFQSQATAQLVDQAQTLQMTVQLRDEQMQQASDELADRGARIGTLEAQVQELQVTLAERAAELDFLADQLHDLQLDLDDANAQLQ